MIISATSNLRKIAVGAIVIPIVTVTAIAALNATAVAQETPTVEREVRFSYASPVIAQRAGTDLSMKDFAARMSVIPPDKRADAIGTPERVASLLNDALLVQHLANAAIERGALEDDELAAQVYFAYIKSLAEWERNRYLSEHALDDYTSQAREIYLVEKDSFRSPDTVSFGHILLRDNGDGDDPAAEAAELMERIESGASSFESLAREHSDDPSVADNGGVFTEITVSELEPGFRRAISGIETGETAIVESQYGIHIVRIDDRQASRQQTFEEVRPQLLKRAREEHARKLFGDYVAEFYDASLDLEDGAVESIMDRYQGPGSDGG